MIKEKLYSIGKIINKSHWLNLICRNFVKKNKDRKTTYDYWLWIKYELIPEEIFAISFLIMIIGLILTMMLWLLTNNILISSLVLLVTISFYYYLQISPYFEAKKDKFFFERSLEQLLLDSSLILESSAEDEEVLFPIYQDIQRLMKFGKKTTKSNRIFRGNPLIGTKSLFDLNITPSKKLNLFLKNIELYAQKYQINLTDFSQEMKMSLNNQALDTKLSFFFFFAIFYPFGVSLLSLIQLVNVASFSVVLAIFPIICYKIRDLVLFSSLKMIGISFEDLKEITTFIALLEGLYINLDFFPPDYAILMTYKSIFPKSRNYSKDKICLNSIFQIVASHFTSNRIKILISYIQKMILKDSKVAHEKIHLIKERLNVQKSIEKQRIRQLKAQKIKIYCFLLVLPIILGIIAGLYPLFSEITLGVGNFQDVFTIGNFMSPNEFSVNPIFFFVGLLSFSLISSYNFTKVMLQQRTFPLMLLTCLIFIISFVLCLFSTRLA